MVVVRVFIFVVAWWLQLDFQYDLHDKENLEVSRGRMSIQLFFKRYVTGLNSFNCFAPGYFHFIKMLITDR